MMKPRLRTASKPSQGSELACDNAGTCAQGCVTPHSPLFLLPRWPGGAGPLDAFPLTPGGLSHVLLVTINATSVQVTSISTPPRGACLGALPCAAQVGLLKLTVRMEVGLDREQELTPASGIHPRLSSDPRACWGLSQCPVLRGEREAQVARRGLRLPRGNGPLNLPVSLLL